MPYLSVLEMSHDKALYKLAYTLLYSTVPLICWRLTAQYKCFDSLINCSAL